MGIPKKDCNPKPEAILSPDAADKMRWATFINIIAAGEAPGMVVTQQFRKRTCADEAGNRKAKRANKLAW